MKRGEIYYIKNPKLEDGCKPMPDRPAVIVSNDMLNAISNRVNIVYMTTNPWDDMPTHVTSRSLDSLSFVLCERIHNVNKASLGTCAGELTEAELKAVDAALAISLGLDFAEAEPKVIEKVVEKVVTREPTKEELDELLEDNIRLRAERDVYRNMYSDLLSRLTGTVSAT